MKVKYIMDTLPFELHNIIFGQLTNGEDKLECRMVCTFLHGMMQGKSLKSFQDVRVAVRKDDTLSIMKSRKIVTHYGFINVHNLAVKHKAYGVLKILSGFYELSKEFYDTVKRFRNGEKKFNVKSSDDFRVVVQLGLHEEFATYLDTNPSFSLQCIATHGDFESFIRFTFRNDPKYLGYIMSEVCGGGNPQIIQFMMDRGFKIDYFSTVAIVESGKKEAVDLITKPLGYNIQSIIVNNDYVHLLHLVTTYRPDLYSLIRKGNLDMLKHFYRENIHAFDYELDWAKRTCQTDIVDYITARRKF